MKIAIITDTHYGARKGSKLFHDYFEEFYKNIFFPTLDEQGIDTVVHMGDAFDSRKGIEFKSLDWAKRVVFNPLKQRGIQKIPDRCVAYRAWHLARDHLRPSASGPAGYT